MIFAQLVFYHPRILWRWIGTWYSRSPIIFTITVRTGSAFRNCAPSSRVLYKWSSRRGKKIQLIFAYCCFPSFPLCSRAEGSITELFFVSSLPSAALREGGWHSSALSVKVAFAGIRPSGFFTDRISSLILSKGGWVDRCEVVWYSSLYLIYQLQFSPSTDGGYDW